MEDKHFAKRISSVAAKRAELYQEQEREAALARDRAAVDEMNETRKEQLREEAAGKVLLRLERAIVAARDGCSPTACEDLASALKAAEKVSIGPTWTPEFCDRLRNSMAEARQLPSTPVRG